MPEQNSTTDGWTSDKPTEPDQIVSPAPCPDHDVIELERGQSMKIMLPEGAEPMIHIGGGEIHIEGTP